MYYNYGTYYGTHLNLDFILKFNNYFTKKYFPTLNYYRILILSIGAI